MADMLIFWRDYRKNASHPVWQWHSNSRLLGKLEPGDGLWFVTSGKNLRLEPGHAGFLVALWPVQEVLANPGDDPAYPREDYRYRLVANVADWIQLDEPVPVDHILRPEGRDQAVAIGRFLQGPRKLDGAKVRLLREAAGPKMALKWLTGPR